MADTSKAPERIFLDGEVEAGAGMFPRCFENPKYCSEPAVEYVRADLYDAAQAEVARLTAALAEAETRGAESMREAAATIALQRTVTPDCLEQVVEALKAYRAAVRALPLPPRERDGQEG